MAGLMGKHLILPRQGSSAILFRNKLERKKDPNILFNLTLMLEMKLLRKKNRTRFFMSIFLHQNGNVSTINFNAQSPTIVERLHAHALWFNFKMFRAMYVAINRMATIINCPSSIPILNANN